MSFRIQNNRRWIGWLLTLTLLFLALPSGAAWQCLDGTPCPFNCPMLQHSSSDTIACATLAGTPCSRCSHCTPAASYSSVTSTKSFTHHSTSLSCTSSKCVVKVSERPASTLQQGIEWHMPLLALPPPPARLPFIVCIAVSPVSFQNRLSFYPQRFLRSASDRAPPIYSII